MPDPIFNPAIPSGDPAPGTPAPPAEPARAQPAPAAVPDVEGIRAEAVRVERERVTAITAVCNHHNIPESMRAGFISGDVDINHVREAILEHLAGSPANDVGTRMTIEPGLDERDKFRSAAQDAILLRAGQSVANPAPGSSQLRGYTLAEMARECLRSRGLEYGGDVMDMVGRALTTSDFPTLLGNVANLQVMQGFEQANETWMAWCGIGSVPNFNQQTIARAGEFDDLLEVKENGEYKHGSADEKKEVYTIAKFGRLFGLSREAIINDDQGAIIDVPRKRGLSAARKVGDLPYDVVIANANMGDGNPLFDATHNNLGTGGVVSVTTIGEADQLMSLQKDISGKSRLNIQPQFFLAPNSIKTSSEVFFTSELIGTQALPAQKNIFAGNVLTRIYEPRLRDDSTTAWYMAGPKGVTVTVFFLNGNQVPFLEQREGWSIDGTEYKVRIEAVAKAVDWVALVKNAGA